jgi:hypothetical protein
MEPERDTDFAGNFGSDARMDGAGACSLYPLCKAVAVSGLPPPRPDVDVARGRVDRRLGGALPPLALPRALVPGRAVTRLGRLPLPGIAGARHRGAPPRRLERAAAERVREAPAGVRRRPEVGPRSRGARQQAGDVVAAVHGGRKEAERCVSRGGGIWFGESEAKPRGMESGR